MFDVDVAEGMPPLKLPYNVAGECYLFSDSLRTSCRQGGAKPYFPGLTIIARSADSRKPLDRRSEIPRQVRITQLVLRAGRRVHTQEHGRSPTWSGSGWQHIRRPVHRRFEVYRSSSIQFFNLARRRRPFHRFVTFPRASRWLLIMSGGSAYSSQPPPKPQTPGVLPVKGVQSFKQINVNAAKGKIAQLNDEVKAANVSGDAEEIDSG